MTPLDLDSVTQNEEDGLRCPKCSESFKKRKHLKRHLTYSKCDEIMSDDQNKESDDYSSTEVYQQQNQDCLDCCTP